MDKINNTFRADFTDLCRRNDKETLMIYDAGFEVKKYSYADTLILCKRCVSFFYQYGLSEGDTVVGVMPNSPEAVICFFAAIIAGLNYAPLPCTVTSREFNTWLSIVKPSLVIRKRGVADFNTNIPVIECDCDGNVDWIGNCEAVHTGSSYASHVYLLTSGTTGAPKAMAIDAERLWQSGLAFAGQYELINSRVRFWNYLPMSYLGGLFNLALIPIACGGSFVISEPFSGKTTLNFWNFVKKHSITALWFVPSIVKGLLKISALVGKNIYEDICKNVKIAFLGTAPITLSQKNKFEEVFSIRLYENFALSETTFLTAEKDSDIRYREQGSVGGVLPYVSLKMVPIDECDGMGVIWAKTPYLFSGYLSLNGDLELELDEDGYFNTKDVGHFNDDGTLVLDGRDRDIIKKGGLFVSLTEIENVMNNHPDIDEAVAVAVDHEFYGESFDLYIMLKDKLNEEETLKKIHLWMIDNFVSYKIPEKIIPVESFPTTASGKIQKRKLIQENI